MRAWVLLATVSFVGCASGSRPIKQLDTFDYMIGGTFNAPGVEFDPEITAWVRFAPYKYFDLTLGGTFTIPLFEKIMYGGLAEARVHIPTGDYLRVVLTGSVELLNYALNDRSRIGLERLTFTPLFVYEQSDITPYFGPKVMYLSKMSFGGDFISDPQIRSRGSGVYMLGLLVGIEDELPDGLVVGGSADFGLLMNGRDIDDAESIAATASFYVGY